jgi:hypothetical protein
MESLVLRAHPPSEHSPICEGEPYHAIVRSITNLGRSAYSLKLLLSQQRHSVIDATSIRTPTLAEIEYLDTFDFFNYPRLPTALRNLQSIPDSVVTGADSTSVSSFPASDFAMPNPESDWLVFRPPHD